MLKLKHKNLTILIGVILVLGIVFVHQTTGANTAKVDSSLPNKTDSSLPNKVDSSLPNKIDSSLPNSILVEDLYMNVVI